MGMEGVCAVVFAFFHSPPLCLSFSYERNMLTTQRKRTTKAAPGMFVLPVPRRDTMARIDALSFQEGVSHFQKRHRRLRSRARTGEHTATDDIRNAAR